VNLQQDHSWNYIEKGISKYSNRGKKTAT